MAERIEVVVDFGADIFNGQQEIYLENLMVQTNGRKPDGVVSSGPRLMKFILGERVADHSRVPAALRPFATIGKAELAAAQHRTFRLDRSDGVFTVNGKPIDIEKPSDLVPQNVPQIWHFENNSGGWWHPVHVHSEFMRVLSRNGARPALSEADGMARKDTILLRGGDRVDIFIKFRDYPGPFVAHCHNLQHEDMAMMTRYDVVPS